MAAVKETVAAVAELEKYQHGFVTDIEQDFAPKGLNTDIVRFISAKKDEPEWMLEWRLEAYRRWLTMTEPTWAKVHYPQIDFQDMYYYAAPKSSNRPKSLDEVDPALLEMYEKLGVPLKERELLAGRIVHNRHPVLTWCAANAVIVDDDAGNRKLSKRRATGRIDCVLAAVMGFGIAHRRKVEPKYQMIFL